MEPIFFFFFFLKKVGDNAVSGLLCLLLVKCYYLSGRYQYANEPRSERNLLKSKTQKFTKVYYKYSKLYWSDQNDFF